MEKEYRTDNFQLAAFLLSEGSCLISLDKTNLRRVQFIFKLTNGLKILIENFLSYKAVCEPHKFFSAQKDLKQLIYSNN
ncbi:MAG: DUF5659 domain-containing protein [Patescibacteria group bacterium]|jgi:hypothetical protein